MKAAITVTILCAALAWPCGDLRAQEQLGKIDFMDGGTIDSSVEMSLGFLYGPGAQPDGLGSPVSTPRVGAACVSGNPAGLAFLDGVAIVVDVLPPLGVSASSFVDVDGFAEDMLDESIEDVRSDGSETIYPTGDLRVGQWGGFSSGALAVPFGRVVVGASLDQPITLGVDLSQTDFEMNSHAIKDLGAGLAEVVLECSGGGVADVQFEVDKMSLGLAAELTPGLGIGAAVSRYTSVGRISAKAELDGSMSYEDLSYAFNDPDDPWYNSLDQSANGSYEAQEVGWSAGASWQMSGAITLDVLYNRMPSMVMDGRLVVVENSIPAFSDDGLDPNLVSLTEPTLTERTERVYDDQLTLHLPSYVGAAVSLRTGFLLTTAEYRRYDGYMGVEYDDEMGGVSPSDGAGLELDFGAVWLGGGVVRATVLGDQDDEAPNEILIPLANAGFGFDIGHLGCDVMLLALPMQVAKVSVGYSF